MIELLDYGFMQRALLAALLVGVAAPAVGIYLVQRRQAIMGDGIGHVALTGVALGFLLNENPVWTAVVVSALGAIAMELIRWYGKARGDLALAMLFYGGMAGGVLIINLSDNGTNANLTTYLFGSITTVSFTDVISIVCLSAFVLAVSLGLRRQLFAVCHDEEFARVTGLPVRLLNLLLAVTAAVTVTVAMRVVGLLLVSALMVIPVAAAQQATRGFAATLALAMGFGALVTLSGAASSYFVNVPPGASIVVLAIGLFVVVTALAVPLTRRRATRAAARAAAGAAAGAMADAAGRTGAAGAPARTEASAEAGSAIGDGVGTVPDAASAGTLEGTHPAGASGGASVGS